MFIVTAVETVGDISGVMEGGMGREATDKELSGGVICDGLGSTFAALFGVLPNTSFSQNVGLVAMTKVVNRMALASGAVFLILCGLIPKLGALISIMPQAVLGGAAVMMFSSIVVSGIQLITALSAALNGGNLMQPYVVKQIIDSDHNIVETTEPTVRRQVISQETSAKICYMGEQVVAGGDDASGRNAAIPGYRIGGKTGTSEKLDNFDENGNQYGNVLSFLGFAPADDPKIAILVALDEPVVGDALSSTIAVPVVGAMLEDILPYLGYEPSFTEEEKAQQEDVTVGNYVNTKPHEAQANIRKAGLKTEIVGQGVSVLKQVPEAGKTLPYGGTVILYTDESEANSNGTVPDVVGRSVSDANQLITNAGFNINIVGSVPDGAEEIIVTQDPPEGSSAEIGSIVTVNIDPDALEKQQEAEQAAAQQESQPEQQEWSEGE